VQLVFVEMTIFLDIGIIVHGLASQSLGKAVQLWQCAAKD